MATADGSSPSVAFLAQKYEETKTQRYRSDGGAQYVDLGKATSSHLQRLVKDPWVDHATLNAQEPQLQDGQHVKFLILGAGFCGLLFAARFIEKGYKSKDIRIVDIAGGWGGTWYWNRYPGLQCDSESLIYMPLLEETGYLPKHRYAHGYEIREHAERIASKYELRGVFRTHMDNFTWNEEHSHWEVSLTQSRGPEGEQKMKVTAQYVVLANGVLNHPKTPKIEGLEDFKGETLHTGRWKYDISGGSPTDWTLDKLAGKRVGIIGTGATSVQCTTQLAKWAGELFVFQRTPSTIDERGQKETSREDWSEATSKPGWWMARNANFAAHVGKEAQRGENLVNDQWSSVDAYGTVVGTQHERLGQEDVPGHIQTTMDKDFARSNRLRARVDGIVKDQETAEGLKAWYPTWCKRPCFHDDYLPIFNNDNIHLVVTEPTGVGKATANGLVVKGKEYALDVLIFSTGYRSPATNLSEPSSACNATILGTKGFTMAEKWQNNGPGTLHGLISRGFPNLFMTGPSQAGASASITYCFALLAEHAAHIVSEVESKAADASKTIIEATQKAEDAWVSDILSYVAYLAPTSVCLPGYYNDEGSLIKGPEDMFKVAKAAAHPQGINHFANILAKWRKEGSLDGIEVRQGS